MVLVLSIDGGGIRGLIPAVVLAEIQRRLTKRGVTTPLCRLVHLMAGTSTGGIIAAGLTCPHKKTPDQPAMTPADLVALYELEGPQIFASDIFRRIKAGTVDERYDEKPLEQKLAHYLGDARLSQALGCVMITAYDIKARRTVFMKGGRPRPPGALPKVPSDYFFKDAARATSAAPTYFEPEPVRDLTTGDVRILVDGGVFNNDPAMSAYIEALKLGYPAEDITVVSLGTGYLTRSFSYNEARNWGAIGWISPTRGTPILSIMMHGQADATMHHLNELLNQDGKPKRYYRFDAPLTLANDDMDDTTPKNLLLLKATAESIIATRGADLDAVVDLLAAEAAAPAPASA